MANIWIWNAIASRRRSSSDTFIDNGLGLLKSSVEAAGHAVRVVDWANGRFYRDLAPGIPTALSRALTLRLMRWPSEKRGAAFRRLNAGGMILQQWIAWIQRKRLARRLRALADEVAGSGLRIFGMKVWYGEAFSWAKYLACEIRRRNPEILLIAGGYHATLYEEDFLRHSPFDLAVVSEGEAALTRILAVVDGLEGTRGREPRIPRIARMGEEKNLTEGNEGNKEALLARIREEIDAGRLINVVYRDGEAIRKTAKVRSDINVKRPPVYGETEGKVRIHVLLESSGCPWGKCHFCVHHHLEPEYLRRRVEKIVDEIRRLREQGIGLFRFAGSDTPPDFGAAIAQGILDAGLVLEFAMGSRAVAGAGEPDVFEGLVEKYALMIRAGLRAVFIGGETGNDTINEHIMNKGLTHQDLVHTIRALRAAEEQAGRRVDISLAMIYPTPLATGVSLERVKADNLRLIKETRPDSVMVTPPCPFKNTTWFQNGKQFGFEFADNFLKQLMEYEYVTFKPPELWPPLGVRLDQRDFVEVLKECGQMRAAVEKTGIPTDLSDEHFLILRACGFKGASGAQEFKRETLADIVSCHYARLETYAEKANTYSRELAGKPEAMEREIPLLHPLRDAAAVSTG